MELQSDDVDHVVLKGKTNTDVMVLRMFLYLQLAHASAWLLPKQITRGNHDCNCKYAVLYELQIKPFHATTYKFGMLIFK